MVRYEPQNLHWKFENCSRSDSQRHDSHHHYNSYLQPIRPSYFHVDISQIIFIYMIHITKLNNDYIFLDWTGFLQIFIDAFYKSKSYWLFQQQNTLIS